MAITPYSGIVPNRLSAGDNTAYATSVYNWFIYLDGTWVTTVNSTEENINAKEALATAAASTATTKAQLSSDYAEKMALEVETGTYSSKEYAIGDLTASGGSAKAWATDTASPDGTTSKSAKTLAEEAAISASSANDSAIAAVAIYDTFDDRELGSKSIAPIVDNDGGALREGAQYWNTTSKKKFLWDGSNWVDQTVIPTDHGSLTNIGTKTHAQLESDIVNLTQSIANLTTASAKAQFGNSFTSPALALTTSEQVLPFDIAVQSTNTDKFEVNETTETISIKAEGTYQFMSTMTFENTTGSSSAATITFNLRDTSDVLLYTESVSIEIGGGNKVPQAFNSILEVTQGMLDSYSGTIEFDINVVSSNTAYRIVEFNSIMSVDGAVFVDTSSTLVNGTITTPTDGAIDFLGEIISTYTTSDSYAGVQDYVEWEAATDSAFTTIVDSYSGAGNLLTWTPNIGAALTTIYVRTKKGSDSHRGNWSETISFTTPNIYIETPTVTVTGTPTDVPETPTITTSAFSVFNGTDTHVSTSRKITRVSDSVVVWEPAADTVNKTSVTVPAGILEVNKAYLFEVKYNGATYGSSAFGNISGTTKSAFAPEQGQKGFGIEPFPSGTPFAALGLAEMTGTNEVGHDNYGNYIHTNGSIVCHYIKKYYRVGHASAPQYAIYGANSLEMVPMGTFANEAAANLAGWVLHRSFIDGGSEKSGFIRDKYLNSKKVGYTNVAVSVKNGNPIGLTTNATYTPSSTMTGCTGILADAVTLCRARGAGWNNESVFMVGWSAMISIAQAQMATSTADVAWYDATRTTNFPKGCNNGSRADVNDVTVTWTASPDTAAKGLTGSASTFAKSTDNGANNGCADVNGLMYQVALGMTNAGANATDSAAIATNTLYVLKKTAYLKDLTAGWNAATDAWGNAGSLATRYDAVTSPITISSAVDSKWGNGANQVLSPDVSGVAHDLCGFLPKNDAATGTTGTSQFGNDRMYKNNLSNMYPYTAGYWLDSASAGVFYRYLNNGRSLDNASLGFRAAAYVS